MSMSSKHREKKVELNHTRRYNLFNTGDRTEFIKEFMAFLRFVAAGEENTGHLRNDNCAIHRSLDESVDVIYPPQEAMDKCDESLWGELYA